MNMRPRRETYEYTRTFGDARGGRVWGRGEGMGAMGECVVCASDKDHDGWREVGTGMFDRCKMRFSRLLL